MPARIPTGLGPRCIDTGNPVANHPLNVGLVMWWSQLPTQWGGTTMFDVVSGQYPGTTTVGTPAPGPSFSGGLLSTSYNGSSAYTAAIVVPITAMPITMCCWFNANDVTTLGTLMALCAAANTDHFHTLQARGTDGGDPIGAYSQAGAGGAAGANSTAGYTAGTWYHACGVFASATSRTVYLNGGNSASNTTSKSPTLDRFSIGRFNGSSASFYFGGRLADIRIYNRALSDTEVGSLYREGLRGNPNVLRRFTPTVWSFGAPAAPAGTFTKLVGSGGLAGVGGGIVGPGGLAG